MSILNDFVDSLVGGDGPGVTGVKDVAVDDSNRAAVVFEDSAQVGVQWAAEESGVKELQRDTLENNRRMMIVEEESFFDDPITADRDKRRLRPTGIQREPNGEFTYPRSDTSPAPNSPSRRGPDGEFVSNDLEDANIGRQDRDGLFDLFK